MSTEQRGFQRAWRIRKTRLGGLEKIFATASRVWISLKNPGILGRRAKENSVDFIEVVATAITPLAVLETVMVKGDETLVDERTTVSYRDGSRPQAC